MSEPEPAVASKPSSGSTFGMRIGIAPKLALVLAIFAVLASGLTAYYAYDTSRQLLVDRAEKNLLTATQVLGQRLVVALANAAKDVRLLADQAGMADSSDEQLARTALSLFRVHPEYFQIRLIDGHAHGLEKVRLDRSGEQIRRVRGLDLQEKSHQLYVSQTLRLQPGQVYLSRIFINHETGAHAGFERPTLILATPVPLAPGQPADGRLVVINIDLETLFADLQAELPLDFRVYLTNEWGDYLIHPDPAQTFGFERGRRVLVQEQFPAVQPLVSGELSDTVINTADLRQKAPSRDLVAAFHRVQPLDFATQRFFILGLAEPLDYVLGEARTLQANMWRMVLSFSLLALLLAWLVSRAVTRPLEQILHAVRRFAAGDHGARPVLPIGRRDEVGTLARGVEDMQAQIRTQVAALEESRQAMAYQAHHDALTGLPNRVTFQDRLTAALAQARRQSSKLGLLFVDLDHFKEVNDQYGHQIGDQLLQTVARRLQTGVRESDTAARLSGDEFVVLLNPVHDAAEALQVAEKLLQRFQEPVQLDTLFLPVQVSIGVSLFPDHGADAETLMEAADAAMYESKAAGRNSCSLAVLPESVPGDSGA